MDNFKRKNDVIDLTASPSPIKKRKMENCPHNERCYRKNPHHFKEFDHPHLIKFIEMGDKIEIPKNMPQPKELYLEQIEILKPILKTTNSNITTPVNTSPQKNSTSNNLDETKNKPGSSKSKSKTGKLANGDPAKNKLRSESKIAEKTGIVPLRDIKILAYDKDCKEGTMLEKLERTAPYNYFFTQIPKSPDTLKQWNSATFTDILCPSLGKLKDSLQINFMIDISWLLQQYQARDLSKLPLTILYGEEFPDMDTFMDKFCPNITHKFVKMKDPYGCHHSKIGVYVYEDNSVRVVISTANLYYEDWNHYNQGFWMSPRCPQLPEGSTPVNGESATGFKGGLINYLQDYKYNILTKWIDYIENADFSAVKVFLLTSVPGKHFIKSNTGCHVQRVGDLLSRHCVLPEKTTPQSEGPLSWGVIAQSSSLGSMGKNAGDWLRTTVLSSLSSHTKSKLPANPNAQLSIIYPSVDNVMKGYFGPESGGCLPYSKSANEKQRWLQEYLHQWKADELTRTRAMPHIKSYTRVSPCMTKLAYFILTSANLSKSAWGGSTTKGDKSNYVRSYEAGVMFLPKFFEEEYFEIKNTTSRKNKNLFPLMYDLPLEPYKSDDYPWCN